MVTDYKAKVGCDAADGDEVAYVRVLHSLII